MLKVGCQLIGLALIVCAGRELHRAARRDQRVSLYGFFNSDTLTCAAFYDDIFVNGYPLDSFYFPTNNVMFPDGILYFIARAVTGAAAPAMVLCSCLLFALQLIGCYLLMRALTPPERRWPQTAILLGMGALFLLVNARTGLSDGFFRLPIILTYHAGSNVCLLFGMPLLAYLLNARDWRRPQRLALAALFVNTMLGMASDRLLLIQMIVPTLAALLLTRLLVGADAGVPLKRIALLGATMFSGAAAGGQLLRIFQPSWQDVLYYYPYTLDGAWMSFRLFAQKWRAQLGAGDELHWLATLWSAACAVHVAWLSMRRTWTRAPLPLPADQRNLLFLSSYYLAMAATCFGAVCYSGLVYNPPYMVDFAWDGAARYFLPVLFLPFFLIGLWLVPWRGWLGERLPVAFALGLFVWVGVGLEQCAQIPRADDQEVWHYYPPYVKRLDDIAAEHNLEYGLAGYWEAKVVTLLSRRRLRVHAIIANPVAATRMVSFHWLSNGRCYFDAPRGGSGPPRYQFILVKEFATNVTPSRAQVRARFGQPAATLPCGPYRVFVYNRPEDTDFQDVANRECYIQRGRYEGRLGETIRFEARTLPSGILGPVPADERIAFAGCTEAGLLSGGPLLHFRETGTYRIRIVTSSPEREKSAGRWQIILINPKKFNAMSIPAQGEVAPGAIRETVVDLRIGNRRRGRALECQVHYSGAGTLQMNYLEVTRIK